MIRDLKQELIEKLVETNEIRIMINPIPGSGNLYKEGLTNQKGEDGISHKEFMK